MAKHHFFVAGTDTDVGKTYVSAALLMLANQHSLRSLGLKPLAAGCQEDGGELHHTDALTLMTHASVKLSYAEINPIALAPAIAPHIAAAQESRRLSADRLVALCRGAMMQSADFVVIEGAGGWRVPLNQRETLAELPKQLALPVVLVVGMKLGCLNHALLTLEAMQHDGVVLAGWVANQIDPNMPNYEDNVMALKQRIPAPCLGVVPWQSTPDVAVFAKQLTLAPLIGGD